LGTNNCLNQSISLKNIIFKPLIIKYITFCIWCVLLKNWSETLQNEVRNKCTFQWSKDLIKVCFKNSLLENGILGKQERGAHKDLKLWTGRGNITLDYWLFQRLNARKRSDFGVRKWGASSNGI